MIKLLSILAGLLAGLYLRAALALYLGQRSLLYRPDPTEIAPAALGLGGVSVERLDAADGTRLVAWFRPGTGPGLILYLHGVGGSLAYRADRIAQLGELGPALLALDYRGFGGSGGEPTEAGLRADADAVYRFARSRGFASDSIVLLGESLGSGIALGLAARVPVGGVALAGAYSSIVDVASDRYWMFPVRLGLRDRFDAASEAGRIRAPLLILHGVDDPVIPLRFAERLAAAAPGADFVPVVDGPHRVLDSDAAMVRLRAWLAERPAFSANPAAAER